MASLIFETDLEKIKLNGALRKEENEHFKTWLKHLNSHKVDLVLTRLNDEIAPHIDCTECGNCCRQLSPYLEKTDLKNLALVTNLSIDEVIIAFTEKDEHGVTFNKMPCPFLAANKCSIYEHRPATCRSFPHLDKPDFNTRLRRTIDNYSICPIIYNVIEKMKHEMGFDDNKY